ncbi:MAG: NADPH:quinone reductase [Pseudomonadota bacterium]|nr:NADPH:quinone reductase [Pseudomonadota bacterium]
MKVARYNSFGSAEAVLEITEIADPVINDEEVLVKINTSGINPSDVKKRAGAFPDLLDNGFVIPHSDGAGIIVDVGTGVSKDRIGQRVWIYQAQYERNFGTASELISIDSRRAVPLPEKASFEVGACLGIPAMTAHRCVYADGSVTGKWVLITGGAGRVGYYAVQWAKLSGAKVITTASNDQDKAMCLDLGADAVVNHCDDKWASDALDATNGEKFDRIIDVEFGVNLPEILNAVKTGATIVTYASAKNPTPELPFLKVMYMDLTIRFVIVYAMPEEAKLEATKGINNAIENGELQHRVTHTLPLKEIHQGHQLIESGKTRGCVLINLD